MGKAHGRGQGHGVLNVPGGVAAADGLEHGVLQGLGVDADAVGPVVQQHLELVPGDGVGPSGLDAVFHAAGQVKTAVQVGQQPVHLLGRQGGGGAAAHIEGLDAQARLPDHLRGVGDLPAQHIQIRLHQPQGFFHRLGHEAAIGAAGGAEGNADVQGDVLRAQVRLGPQARLGRFHRQTAAGRGDVVGVPQNAAGLGRGLALLQQTGRQLAGADARQRPPAGGDAGDLPCRLEKA